MTESKVDKVLAAFDCDDGRVYWSSQSVRDGRSVDVEDRIQLCVRLVRALAAEGL